MSTQLKSVINKLTPRSRSALDIAISHAASRNHTGITPEHFLLALITRENDLLQSLKCHAGLPVNELVEGLKIILEQLHPDSLSEPVFTPELVKWLEVSWILASAQRGLQQLSPSSLIAALFNNDGGEFLSPLVQQSLCCDRQQAQHLLLTTNDGAEGHVEYPKESDSALRKYTRNLSEMARLGKLDPVLGRESEIRQMVDILLRRRQNNPILTGAPGVGKTALVEGLALRIAEGTVPQLLKSMEVLILDLGLLQAGASVKGEFENRLHSLLKEIDCSIHPVILFIDEAHTIIGAGGPAGQNDAANLLKPALARGELRIIAATTWSEYKQYFEKDAALARRFQLVRVPEPTVENAVIMLRALTPAMSLHHGIPVLESAIHAAVSLSSRYIPGRQLPDKAITLLDTACARVAVSRVHLPKEVESLTVQIRAVQDECEALRRENASQKPLQTLSQQVTELRCSLDDLTEEWHYQNELVQKLIQSQDTEEIVRYRRKLETQHKEHAMVFECVDAICVADVVSDWTGIPLGRMLEQTPRHAAPLLEQLSRRVIGQKHALVQLTRQISINRAGMSDPLKPTGVYMLAGPSGTGKTETALALAELLFGGENNLVTINMSEYQEAHSVSGLKGAPPGYVGYGQGGILTEAVLHNPYCVLLLDEVEKAHPDVMKLFYQIFDKGVIEDAEGQSVNFRNTLIIMTSNLASATLVTAFNEGKCTPEELEERIRPEFEQTFSPAMMGRMTLIPYLPLQLGVLEKIISIKLNKLCHRYQCTSACTNLPVYSKQVVSWIAERCLVQQSGARDIDRILNQHLVPLLAEQVLQGNTLQELRIEIDENILVINAEKVGG